MIEPIYLSISGYKSIFSEQTVKISPLTILAGANSSGKSSFMQPLLLMKQTTEAPFDPGIFLLDGELIKLTSINQIFSRYGDKKAASLLSVTLVENNTSESYGYKKSKSGLAFDNIKIKLKGTDELVFTEDMILNQPFHISNKPAQDAIQDRCFINLIEILSKEDQKFSAKIHMSRMKAVTSSIIYLPGLRGNPERNYSIASVDNILKKRIKISKNIFSGKFEKYIASILLYWSLNSTKNNNVSIIEEQLSLLGLNSGLKIEKVNDAYIELNIGRLNKQNKSKTDFVNIADVGLGVSQVLPVLVALLVAEKGQIVYIEQPELHLHPKAQLALAGIIADAAKRDVRVVIETHSSLLILGIQTLVAKNELDRELVALHWFTRDQSTGETTVTQAELDENGAFGDWPEDFDDITLKAEQNYLDAVEAKQYASH